MSTSNTTPPHHPTALKQELIPAEIAAVITAAVAVFVGRRMHIRSIEQLHSSRELVSRWSRQGRVLVHSSHNLPVKR
jgi:hypothetical protein